MQKNQDTKRIWLRAFIGVVGFALIHLMLVVIARHLSHNIFTALGDPLTLVESISIMLLAVLAFPLGYLPWQAVFGASQWTLITANSLIWGFGLWSICHSLFHFLRPSQDPTSRLPRFSLAWVLVVLTMVGVALGWAANNAQNAKIIGDEEFRLTELWTARGARPDIYYGKVEGLFVSSDNQLEHVAECQNLKTLVCEVGYTESPGIGTAGPIQTEIYVTDAGMAHVKQLQNLQQLVLSNSLVTDEGLENLAGLSKLESLGLDGTQITNAGLAHLVRLTSLTDLHLSNTRITDDAIVHLEKMNWLEFLYLDNSGMTKRGVEKLKSRLPECAVISHYD